MSKLANKLFLAILCLGSFALQGQAVAAQLVVSAAASLKDVLIEAGKVFERSHPNTKISFNFASSNQLALQIEQGAPVDVYASSDIVHVRRLAAKNLLAENAVLAHNQLIVIASKKSNAKLESLADLSSKGLRLIMAGSQIPVSTYSRQFLKKVDASGIYGADYSTRVLANIVSEEADVRMVAMKVGLGEGDLGIVYVSDVTSDLKSKVRQIPIADQFNVKGEYGVAVVKKSRHAETAKAFYQFLLSPTGQEILKKNGFLPAKSESK